MARNPLLEPFKFKKGTVAVYDGRKLKKKTERKTETEQEREIEKRRKKIDLLSLWKEKRENRERKIHALI